VSHHVLFICTHNIMRSRTGEELFASWPGIETASAGTNNDAAVPITPELLQWADTIFVMEQVHRRKLSYRFQPHLKNKRVICLEIPDDYNFMDAELVELMQARVPPHLPSTVAR